MVGVILGFWVVDVGKLISSKLIEEIPSLKKQEDVGFLGGYEGASFSYYVEGIVFGLGTSKDSIVSIFSTDSIGRCIFTDSIPFAIRTEYYLTDSTPSGRLDTSYMFVADSLAKYGGLTIYKLGAVPFSDTWEAWDTCAIAVDSAIAIGDVDQDNQVDTLIPYASVGRALIPSGDTLVSRLALNYRLVLTSFAGLFDSLVVSDIYHFKIVPNSFIALISYDTTQQVAYAGGNSFPLTQVNVLKKTLYAYSIPVSVHEDEVLSFAGSILKLPSRVERAKVSLYDVSGKLRKVFSIEDTDRIVLEGVKGAIYVVVVETKSRRWIFKLIPR